MKPETIAAPAAPTPNPATGAVAPPLCLTTTYERDADAGFSRGLVYFHINNPNRESLEVTTPKARTLAASLMANRESTN